MSVQSYCQTACTSILRNGTRSILETKFTVNSRGLPAVWHVKEIAIGLTGLCSVRGCGGCGQSGDAAKRLSAAVFDAPAVARRGGRRQPLAPHGSPDHRDLVEFVATVVVAQSRRAGAGPAAAADAAVIPGTGVGTTAAGAPPSAPAPKRLHQSLGARRHSTEVIQPSGLRFLLF